MQPATCNHLATPTTISSFNPLPNHVCLRRPQHDSPGLVGLQHGARRLRHNWCQEAWRSSTTSEIIAFSPKIPLILLAPPRRYFLFCCHIWMGIPRRPWLLEFDASTFAIRTVSVSHLARLILGSNTNGRNLDICNTIVLFFSVLFSLIRHWPCATPYTLF